MENNVMSPTEIHIQMVRIKAEMVQTKKNTSDKPNLFYIHYLNVQIQSCRLSTE